jgi:hypothetical protein
VNYVTRASIQHSPVKTLLDARFDVDDSADDDGDISAFLKVSNQPTPDSESARPSGTIALTCGSYNLGDLVFGVKKTFQSHLMYSATNLELNCKERRRFFFA